MGSKVGQLAGDQDEVWFVQFSHDGRWLAAGGKDTAVRIWDVHDSLQHEEASEDALKWRLQGHTTAVGYLSWAPDDKQLLTCGKNGKLVLWDVESGQKVRDYDGHREQVLVCAWAASVRQFYSGSSDRKLLVWDVDQELPAYTISDACIVVDMAVSGDGKQLVCCTCNCTVGIYDTATRAQLYELKMDQQIVCCSLASDGRSLLVSLVGQEMQLWDLETRTLKQRYLGFEQGKFSVRNCFGGAEQGAVFSGSEDSLVYAWQRYSCRLLLTLEGHTACVNAVHSSPVDAQLVASGSDDGKVFLWRLDEDVTADDNAVPLPGIKVKEVLRLDEQGEVWMVKFSHNGHRLATACKDSTIGIWNVQAVYDGTFEAEDVLERRLEGHQKSVSGVAWSADDRRLLSWGWDEQIILWDVESGQKMRSFEEHKNRVTACVWALEGDRFYSGSSEARLLEWHIEADDIEGVFNVEREVMDLALTSEGKLLICALSDKSITVFDTERRTKLYMMRETMYITSCVLADDDRHLLVNLTEIGCSDNGEIHTWNVETRRLVQRYKGFKQLRFVIQSSFGGNRQQLVMSGSENENNAVHIWNRHTSELLHTVQGHARCVNSVHSSPANWMHVASGSDDGKVILWLLSSENAVEE